MNNYSLDNHCDHHLIGDFLYGGLDTTNHVKCHWEINIQYLVENLIIPFEISLL